MGVDVYDDQVCDGRVRGFCMRSALLTLDSLTPHIFDNCGAVDVHGDEIESSLTLVQHIMECGS